MTHPRIPLLGVHISALDMHMALEKIKTCVALKQQDYVCVAPAHSLMECIDNTSLYPVFNSAGMVTPDGMAVVWLLKLHGAKQVSRVYGPDLLLSACEYGLSQNWRHYFYGGAQGVAERLAEKLCARYPDLQVVGTYSPPFSTPNEKEDETGVQLINASEADIVWVGLSSPKQEVWMYKQLGVVNAPVMIGVGAAFDFLSGMKPQAPLWMQRSGLEWLFRFLSEPNRLWPRYRKYPRFVLLSLAELLGWHINS